NHPDVKNKVFDYIDKLKKDNIYILKKGELEDYVTSEGQKLIEDLGLSNQKELKVIKLAELIDNDEIEIEQVLDIGDYVEVIQNLIFNS
ncbi:MAG: chromosome segregation protein SMC, partial [Clostridiales bacterium]|nr:chromosome segregation protein SMC [Clostridiales bacterium]